MADDGIIYVNGEDLWKDTITYPSNESLGEGNALDILIAAIDRMEKNNPAIDIFKTLG